MTNPFSGLIPDFSVFGVEFTAWWQKLFTGLWALCILGAGAYLLVSVVQLHKATTNNIPGQADEAKSKVAWSAAAVGVLAGFGVVMGAIIAFAG